LNGLCTLIDGGPSAQRLLHREFIPCYAYAICHQYATRGLSTTARQQTDEEELTEGVLPESDGG
jgi:hypothetical protein